jgi:peptidoglycan/xylan/chitin deacetylase (PgdA/CDA1 family)
MARLSKTDALARALSGSGALRLQRSIGLMRSNQFVVLTYHRIADHVLNGTYPFDADLISATSAEFDWQMSFLARNFRPATLGSLLRSCAENRPIPAGSVAVTFDDGFLDNYSVAYPILRRHGVPATFFVTTDFIEHNQPIWFEVVAFAYLNLPVNSIVHPLCPSAEPSRAERDVRLGEFGRVMRKLKQIPDEQRSEFVAHLATLIDTAALGEAWARFGGAMRWEHIVEVARNSIEIGSHTVSHPILSRTSGDALQLELSTSKRLLEEKVGLPVELLAYPVGGRRHYSPEVIRVAKEAGYRNGITYVAGVNRLGCVDPFAVRRHTVERHTTRELFEAQLCLPGLFGRRVPGRYLLHDRRRSV